MIGKYHFDGGWYEPQPQSVNGFPWYIKAISSYPDQKMMIMLYKIYLANNLKIGTHIPIEILHTHKNINQFILDRINYCIEDSYEQFKDLDIWEEHPISAPSWSNTLKIIRPEFKHLSGKASYVNEAYVGVTKNYFSPEPGIGDTVETIMSTLFPVLNSYIRCPVKECEFKHSKASLKNVIIGLNDRHKWTREQIADWLESLDLNLEVKGTNV